MIRNEKVRNIENWRNVRPVYFGVEIIKISIKLKKIFREFFLMTSVIHDSPLGKNVFRAAILQTSSDYCCLTEVAHKIKLAEQLLNKSMISQEMCWDIFTCYFVLLE